MAIHYASGLRKQLRPKNQDCTYVPVKRTVIPVTNVTGESQWDSSVVKCWARNRARAWVQIPVMTGFYCEYELKTKTSSVKRRGINTDPPRGAGEKDEHKTRQLKHNSEEVMRTKRGK